MPIGISTGSCRHGVAGREKQVKLISSFEKEIDGIEVIFATPYELVNFNLHGRIAAELKKFSFVSIHYPFPRSVQASKINESRITAKLKAIDKVIGLKHVVVHPASMKNWRNFKKAGVKILLENQGPDIDTRWQKPSEMKKILRKTGFGMCLDLNHSIGCGINPAEFLQFKSKIGQLHVNATEKIGIDAHKFLIDVSPKTIALLKPVLRELRNAVWMSEVRYKHNPASKLKQEIKLFKSI